MISLLILLLAAAPEKPLKPLPTFAKEPVLDGDLRDFVPAAEFKMPPSAKGASAQLQVQGGFRKDTLFVAVRVQDDDVTDADELDVTLFFPESGTTARGFVYRFGTNGVRDMPGEAAAPPFATKLVRAGVHTGKQGFVVEVAFPPRSLPRFQASKPLALSICAEYADTDNQGEASKLNTCPHVEMEGGPTRLPDEFRKTLKLAPPADVEGVEARETGWIGFSKLHYPTWVQADAELTVESLGSIIAGDRVVDAHSVALPIPKELRLPDNRPIFTLLTGQNPYAKDACDASKELRMAMYVVKGTAAARVLEWPAATCTLGRAMRFELGDEGTLSIGYTNGATQHFAWADDHFERSELGLR